MAETASTNDAVRRLPGPAPGELVALIADRQTAGRGRLGRGWHSPAGLGLYLSVALRPEQPPATVGRWTLGAAVAVCRACRAHGAAAAVIEWPNDVYAGGRKLAGILAELRTVADACGDLVLGIGVNVHHRAGDFPPELRGCAVSLRLVAGETQMLRRDDLAASCLEELWTVARRIGGAEWPAVATEWESLAPGSRGGAVRLRDGRAATTRGLTESGTLCVELEDGTSIEVRMADALSRTR